MSSKYFLSICLSMLCLALWAGGKVVVKTDDEMCVGDSKTGTAEWEGPSGATSWSWSVSGAEIVDGDGTAIINIKINTETAGEKTIVAVCTVTWENGEESSPIGRKKIMIHEFVRDGSGRVKIGSWVPKPVPPIIKNVNGHGVGQTVIITAPIDGTYNKASTDKCDGSWDHTYKGKVSGSLDMWTQDTAWVGSGGAFMGIRVTGKVDNTVVYDAAGAVDTLSGSTYGASFTFGASAKDGVSTGLTVSISKKPGGTATASVPIDGDIPVKVLKESPEQVSLTVSLEAKEILSGSFSDYGKNFKYYYLVNTPWTLDEEVTGEHFHK